jgi:hypothetical protein
MGKRKDGKAPAGRNRTRPRGEGRPDDDSRVFFEYYRDLRAGQLRDLFKQAEGILERSKLDDGTPVATNVWKILQVVVPGFESPHPPELTPPGTIVYDLDRAEKALGLRLKTVKPANKDDPARRRAFEAVRKRMRDARRRIAEEGGGPEEAVKVGAIFRRWPKLEKAYINARIKVFGQMEISETWLAATAAAIANAALECQDLEGMRALDERARECQAALHGDPEALRKLAEKFRKLSDSGAEGGAAGLGKPKRDPAALIRRITASPTYSESDNDVFDFLANDDISNRGWAWFAGQDPNLPIERVDVDRLTKRVTFLFTDEDGRDPVTITFDAVRKTIERARKSTADK